MSIQKTKFCISILLVMVACQPDLSDDPIPYIPFNEIIINLSFPEYATLRTDGGYKEVNGGVRGIIVYRVNATSYNAFERNCSFHPNDACATVNIHSSSLYMTDPCCGSTFDFSDGNPSGGVAWRPLRKYRTQLTGTTLSITDEVIN
ncbi:MAG: hypothetical protein JJE09_05220 [Bacteroidia bacterium]|nr:hypothetical protein [Bacteroidia bacterium]